MRRKQQPAALLLVLLLAFTAGASARVSIRCWVCSS
jgi:hypothetical protein